MQFIIKNVSPYTFVVLLILIFVISPIPLKYSQAIAQVDTLCEKLMNEAEVEYRAGRWTEAIDHINQCLGEPKITEVEKGTAYRLLGLVYIAIELEKEANEAVRNLLLMVPNYKIDPDRDPPQLKRIIDDVSQKLQPTISSITPTKATAGDPGFTITVNGKDFVYGSVVRFNDRDKVTNYVSQTQLTAEIPTTDLINEGEYKIAVFSPILDGKLSNAEKFTIKSASKTLMWVLIGGGVAVGVAAIIVLSGGDEDIPPGEFPGPPGRPGN
ncbi:MAG: IPT/TIG domain-containing protein [Bacteroidetes bacterium]|nr:IPT/TIG domain-containing protein [Bacteroidota bacterium]